MLDFDLRMFLQILGAVFAVTNYVLIQTRRLSATQPASLSIVASAGVILLASAIMGGDWGLILLEVSWLIMVTVTLVVRHREATRTLAVTQAALPAAMVTAGEIELVGVGG